MLNHKHPTEIIKQFEVFEIQFENPTINASVKYSINDKINNNEYNNKRKNQENGNKKNNLGNMRKPENNNFTSNQNEYFSNNGLLDINGHFKAELLERNKLTCSFRKLKSNNAFSHKNSGLNNTSTIGLDDNNLNNIKPPFQYASLNNKNQNNYNTNNSNLNNFNGNNYNTRETISKRKAMYQSVNQSLLNCSSLAIKIFWTKQEQTAKNIEEGFEKLQKLARKLKIIENNKQNSRLSCVMIYDDLFDILEFKGMEKERDIIDKHIQQKKKRTNTEIKRPFKKNLIEINDESVTNFSEIKKNYAKNNFDSNAQIDIQDKQFNYNTNNEIPTFTKENFLSMAALDTTTKKIRDSEFSTLNNEYKKEDYSTNIFTNDKNLSCRKASDHIQSQNNKNFNKEKKNHKLKLKSREHDSLSENSDIQNRKEQEMEFCLGRAVDNPFKTNINHNTASKGLPPRNKNLLTSCKKALIQPQHFSTTKKIKINDFQNSPKIRSSSGASKNIYNFNEKIEMASKMPFAKINSNFAERNSNFNFSADKKVEIKQRDTKQNKLDSTYKNNDKFMNRIVLNSHNEDYDRINENNENFDSMNIKVNSRELEMNNDLNNHDKKLVKNPFKKQQNKKNKNYFSNKAKITENYASNYASNNALSNFNSNNRDSSLIYKTNDKYNKSNYDTNDMRETINENSQITSASILSYNNEYNSNLQSNYNQNILPFNVNTNNMKTNELYTSNSFADLNSEMIDSEYCSNTSNFKNNKKNIRNYKNFKNDFDNYEEYESAMRKMQIITEEENGMIIKGKREISRNFNSNKNNKKKRNSNNSNINIATESDFISDFSKNSRISNNSQINNFSYITKSSISDMDI